MYISALHIKALGKDKMSSYLFTPGRGKQARQWLLPTDPAEKFLIQCAFEQLFDGKHADKFHEIILVLSDDSGEPIICTKEKENLIIFRQNQVISEEEFRSLHQNSGLHSIENGKSFLWTDYFEIGRADDIHPALEPKYYQQNISDTNKSKYRNFLAENIHHSTENIKREFGIKDKISIDWLESAKKLVFNAPHIRTQMDNMKDLAAEIQEAEKLLQKSASIEKLKNSFMTMTEAGAVSGILTSRPTDVQDPDDRYTRITSELNKIQQKVSIPPKAALKLLEKMLSNFQLIARVQLTNDVYKILEKKKDELTSFFNAPIKSLAVSIQEGRKIDNFSFLKLKDQLGLISDKVKVEADLQNKDQNSSWFESFKFYQANDKKEDTTPDTTTKFLDIFADCQKTLDLHEEFRKKMISQLERICQAGKISVEDFSVLVETYERHHAEVSKEWSDFCSEPILETISSVNEYYNLCVTLQKIIALSTEKRSLDYARKVKENAHKKGYEILNRSVEKTEARPRAMHLATEVLTKELNHLSSSASTCWERATKVLALNEKVKLLKKALLNCEEEIVAFQNASKELFTVKDGEISLSAMLQALENCSQDIYLLERSLHAIEETLNIDGRLAKNASFIDIVTIAMENDDLIHELKTTDLLNMSFSRSMKLIKVSENVQADFMKMGLGRVSKSHTEHDSHEIYKKYGIPRKLLSVEEISHLTKAPDEHPTGSGKSLVSRWGTPTLGRQAGENQQRVREVEQQQYDDLRAKKIKDTLDILNGRKT